MNKASDKKQVDSTQNPYFFDYSNAEDQQTPDANMFGNPADMGLAIPMPVDGAGIGTSYWKLQSMQAPPWSLESGEPSEGGRAVTAPLNPQLPQDYRWLLSSGNPLRTLTLYGKVDGSPNSTPVDFDTHVPVYLVQPINEVDPKPLSGMYSGVYTAYRDSKRQVIESGVAESNVLGGDRIDFGPAVQPTNFNKNLPLSTWAPELLGAHRNLRASDRVACAWLLSTLMRVSYHHTSVEFEVPLEWRYLPDEDHCHTTPRNYHGKDLHFHQLEYRSRLT